MRPTLSVLAPGSCDRAAAGIPCGVAVGDEGHASALLSVTIECARRWITAASRGRAHLPGWVTCGNAFEAAGALLEAREGFSAGSDENRALDELHHAARALDAFRTSRRRGVLDEVLQRAHRAFALARQHDNEASDTWRRRWSAL
jgi:hypothetical protein